MENLVDAAIEELLNARGQAMWLCMFLERKAQQNPSFARYCRLD